MAGRETADRGAVAQKADSESTTGAAGRVDELAARGGAMAAIYLEPGGAAGTASASPAVDHALAQAGQGESHPSGARLHHDATAATAAGALGAQAFTAGGDVYFGAGHDPSTPRGQETLRHELVHVEQSRGQAAPRPGNYRVSDPAEPAEKEASAGAASGAGPSGTIFRQTPPPATTGAAGGAGGSTGGGTGGAPAVTPAGGAGPGAGDPLATFQAALAAHNGPQASGAWSKLTSEQKHTAGTDQGMVTRMLEVMDTDSLIAIKEAGVTFAGHPAWARTALAQATSASWWTAMKQNALADTFLAAMPHHATLTDDEAKTLNQFVAADAASAKKIFELTYPPLQTVSYDAKRLKVKAWPSDLIQRMYRTLATKLPINAVQTITGGFFLADQQRDDDSSGNPTGRWYLTTGAWYTESGQVVVPMPGNSGRDAQGQRSSYDGSPEDSTMSGGVPSAPGQIGSGAATPIDVAKHDPNDQPMSHFGASLLHEVGHGVGSHCGADAWCTSGASMPNWTKHSDPHVWGASLMVPATPVAPAGHEPAVPLADATNYMSDDVANNSPVVPAAFHGNLRNFEAALNHQWGGTKLYQYWKSVAKGNDRDNGYTLANLQNTGARVYIYSTRWGNSLCSYKSKAFDQRVSEYSLSSPFEWFAEQYTEYYRTNRQSGRIDGDTKSKLDEIHTMHFDSSHSLTAASGASPTASPGQLTTAGIGFFTLFNLAQQLNALATGILGGTSPGAAGGATGPAAGGGGAGAAQSSAATGNANAASPPARRPRRPFPFEWA